MLESYFKNVKSENVIFEISRGKIPGMCFFPLAGDNGAVGTTIETIWDGGGLYTYPSVASQMYVTSDNVNDTEGGTGVQETFIIGLDVNNNWQYETVVMNGLTGRLTEKSYKRINFWQNTKVGSSGYNAGKLYIGTGTITDGIPANIYAVLNGTVSTHDNRMKQAVFTVPKGYNAYPLGYLVGVQAAKELTAALYHRGSNGVMVGGGEIIVYQNALEIQLTGLEKFSEGTDLEIRGFSDVGDLFVRVSSTLLLERFDDTVPFILPNLTLSDTWS